MYKGYSVLYKNFASMEYINTGRNFLVLNI